MMSYSTLEEWRALLDRSNVKSKLYVILNGFLNRKEEVVFIWNQLSLSKYNQLITGFIPLSVCYGTCLRDPLYGLNVVNQGLSG